MATNSYEIDQRRAEVGGGWRLRLIEDGQEVGGGVFPVDPNADDQEQELSDCHADALGEAEAWLSSR